MLGLCFQQVKYNLKNIHRNIEVIRFTRKFYFDKYKFDKALDVLAMKDPKYGISIILRSDVIGEQ